MEHAVATPAAGRAAMMDSRHAPAVASHPSHRATAGGLHKSGAAFYAFARFTLPILDQRPGGPMNRGLKRIWGFIATAAVMCVLPTLVGAAMVSTDQAIGQGAAEQDRARVQAFLDRADARQQLQAMGVDALMAKDRVTGLTDQEVHALARKLDTLPAGGNLGNNEVIAILLIVLLVVLLI
jgi:hypothetical protein